MRSRCGWSETDPLYTVYHDREWGVPLHDDRRLFEMLILEGAQAGLSWITVLRKRENFRRAFDGFQAGKIAQYKSRRIKRLLADDGIIRNRLKILATIQNAKAFLQIRREFGSFDKYIWQFVHGMPVQNSWKRLQDVPAVTAESTAMSKDLRRRGFNFVGPTICYAFMQATGMVNDHIVACFRHAELKKRKTSGSNRASSS